MQPVSLHPFRSRGNPASELGLGLPAQPAFWDFVLLSLSETFQCVPSRHEVVHDG